MPKQKKQKNKILEQKSVNGKKIPSSFVIFIVIGFLTALFLINIFATGEDTVNSKPLNNIFEGGSQNQLNLDLNSSQ